MALDAIHAAAIPPLEEAASAPPELVTIASAVPVPANTSARGSGAEPVRLVAAESVVPARTPAELVSVEIVDEVESATLNVGSWEVAAEVKDMDEAADESPLQEVAQTPPAPATLPSPEEAMPLAAIETEWRPPPEEAAPTPPESATLPSPESAEPLTAIEAARGSPPEESVSILSEPVPPPSPEDAVVLAAIETAGSPPVEEAISTFPEPELTPSVAPLPVDTPQNDFVPEPVGLVAAESVVPARAPAAPEPAEIVDSAELVTLRVASRELAAEVPGVDEAATELPLPEAASTPPAPATPPPFEEAEVLTAIETAGNPRLEEAAPTPPVPAEIVGPTEEVEMHAVADLMASTSAPRGPGAQETQPTPAAGEGAGSPPGPADDEAVSAGRAEYLARLQDRLSKRLTYPHVARSHRQTGTASLYVAVDRTGRVQAYEIRTSTGHELLDREARAMIERARPFPPLPEEMRQERLELLLNIEFVLE